MSDDFVQVSPDSSGKKVDTTVLVRSALDASGNTVSVERQRVSIGSDTDPISVVDVNAAGEMSVRMDLDPIVIQLKRIALLLEILTDTHVSDKDVTNAA